MEFHQTFARKRGRPPKRPEDTLETRELLVRAGLEALTEKGFSSTGIDEVLKRVGVPKGSFYHYFESKEAFGATLIDRYASYFAHKLERHFNDQSKKPLERLWAFVEDARGGMARHDFRRGCLIGNLGQEMAALPESFRASLNAVFDDWERRFARCLEAAQREGEIPAAVDCAQQATFFWIGWEGAVLRAKLERSTKPLEIFARGFFVGLQRA